MTFDTPILLLLYNRPDTSRVVFDAIRRIQPRQLFVAADGPSATRRNDHDKCAEVRALVATVDWPCEVRTLFREDNLGCRKAISSAISWFFDQVESGVILEDDCLPSNSFFRYCEELLERYRDNDQVMVISGDNFQDGRKVTGDSYYFSRYPHCWGWATWRRAWRRYDAQLQGWPAYRDSNDFMVIGADNPIFRNYWSRNFDRVLNGEVDSWAYVWTFSCWVNGGLTAIPQRNLVKNIGFGPDATHTRGANSRLAAMRAEELDLPLRHPALISRHQAADRYTDINHFGMKLDGEPGTLSVLLGRLAASLTRVLGR